MLDVALLRNDPEALAAAMTRRGVSVDIDALADLDKRRRQARSEAEGLRSRQKEAGKAIAELDGDAKQQAITEMSSIAERYKILLAEADTMDARFDEQFVVLPNVADP
ncbi:MAG: hypothetical protein KJO18_04035, partial [Acidimicrobiia bacterium]|nr:hypothetical protein [Acidimicrobiia bacterium]